MGSLFRRDEQWIVMRRVASLRVGRVTTSLAGAAKSRAQVVVCYSADQPGCVSLSASNACAAGTRTRCLVLAQLAPLAKMARRRHMRRKVRPWRSDQPGGLFFAEQRIGRMDSARRQIESGIGSPRGSTIAERTATNTWPLRSDPSPRRTHRPFDRFLLGRRSASRLLALPLGPLWAAVCVVTMVVRRAHRAARNDQGVSRDFR